MSAVIAIGRVRYIAARIADSSRHHAVITADEVLHTPEAAPGKNRSLRFHRIPPLGSVLAYRIPRVVLGMNVGETQRTDRRHLGNILAGLCPVEMRLIAWKNQYATH